MSEITVEFAGNQKPMVTREQYERGREVLDALPPGIYVKCCGCKRWSTGGNATIKVTGPYCERCA